jgi:hypothetical protein
MVRPDVCKTVILRPLPLRAPPGESLSKPPSLIFLASALRQPCALQGLITSRKGETPMAKPNYAFAKRQRELEKKRKKEEKALGRKEPQEPEAAAAPVPAAVVPATPEPK